MTSFFSSHLNSLPLCLLLAVFLLPISIIDLRTQRIPPVLSIGLLVAGLAFAWLPGGLSPLQSFIGAVAGGGALFLVALIGEKLSGREDAMGGGDIKLMAGIGSCIGPWLVLPVLATASFMALAFVLLTWKQGIRGRKIVFGPFLAFGTAFAFFIARLIQ
ncbi:MAG: A24 family peptidase [Fibrobacterota bacterium]